LHPEVPLLNLDASNITSSNITPKQHKKVKEEDKSELEEMRKELQHKDSQIRNLRERLVELEDKVNTIQRDDKREKSQQKIKQTIKKLETCLKMFYKDYQGVKESSVMESLPTSRHN
jgi:archaellum component FlaC